MESQKCKVTISGREYLYEKGTSYQEIAKDFQEEYKHQIALVMLDGHRLQELRKQEQPQMTEELKELQEELLAHYGKGTFLIPVEENGQIPILKQKDGSLYQPVFTDVLEFQKFTKGRPVRSAVVPGEKIAELLMEDVKGVVLNPLGVNVQLQVARRKRE